MQHTTKHRFSCVSIVCGVLAQIYSTLLLLMLMCLLLLQLSCGMLHFIVLRSNNSSTDYFSTRMLNKCCVGAASFPRYWPGVEESKLVPDYSGIRPKLVGSDGPSVFVHHDNDDDDAGHHRALGEEPHEEHRRYPPVPRRGASHFRGAADFVIQGRDEHGVDGLVNLMGIESPGLTASLAIADHVVGMLERRPRQQQGAPLS